MFTAINCEHETVSIDTPYKNYPSSLSLISCFFFRLLYLKNISHLHHLHVNVPNGLWFSNTTHSRNLILYICIFTCSIGYYLSSIDTISTGLFYICMALEVFQPLPFLSLLLLLLLYSFNVWYIRLHFYAVFTKRMITAYRQPLATRLDISIIYILTWTTACYNWNITKR